MFHSRALCTVVLVCAALLQGCAAVVVGGALVAADVAHDRRPAATVAADRNIQLTARDALNRHKELVRDDNDVKVIVYDGTMLLAVRSVRDGGYTGTEPRSLTLAIQPAAFLF